jgi:hypothetical protein
MTEIPVPQCITNKLIELNQLVEKYPKDIPVSAAADFLGMDGRSLKSYLMNPLNALGLDWKREKAANRGFHIPTAKFYLWYRNLNRKEV